MKRLILVISLAGWFLAMAPKGYAADIEAVLDDAAGVSAFSVKNSGSVEQAHIDSNGNMVIKGGLRLDASGVENTTAENLIVDGSVGIGTTTPGSALDILVSGGQFMQLQNGGSSSSIYTRYSNVNGFAYFGKENSTGTAIHASGGLPYSFFIDEVNNAIQFSTAHTSRMTILNNGNVGIGTTTPNASALLDVSSTTNGFLPPRMTTTQRNAISTPPAGLMIYNTTTNKLNFYNGTAWEAVTSA